MSGHTPGEGLEQSVFRVGGQSFVIRVLLRQNADWQGEITWMDGKRTCYFRSLLEMVVLLEEALAEAGVPEADYQLRSWKDATRGVS